MSNIPVYLLTGYLGSGKTTALNHLLRQEELRQHRIALIINEFGSLGVDGQLVPAQDNRIFEINRGSLFCACTKTEFLETFDTIADDHMPDIVIAEATGVGETSDLFDIFSRPPIRDRFHIRANACVVDAKNFTKVLPYLKAAHAQVKLADGIILNKTDLLGQREMSRLADLIRELNNQAPQIRVQQGQVDWAFIQQLTHISRSAMASVAAPAEVAVCSLMGDWADRDRLRATIMNLGPQLLRLKGLVDFGGGPVLVESVFGSYEETPLADLPNSPGLTAIGWRIRCEDLRAALSPCIRATDNLISL